VLPPPVLNTEPAVPRWDRRDTVVAALLATLAVLSHLPLAFDSVGGCDEWHILAAGAELRAGKVLYRDVTHIAGPGSFYLAALLFRLFGTHFEVTRLAMVVVFASMVAATYALTRRLAARMPAVGAALWLIAFRLWAFPHWQMFHYASLALAAATAAFVLLHAEAPGRMSRDVLAGFLAGVAIITKQDSGGLAAVACTAAIAMGDAARRRGGMPARCWARLAAFGTGVAMPLGLVIAYFGAEGALGELFLQTVYDTLVQHPLFVAGTGTEHVDYLPFPSLFPLGQDPVLRSRLVSYVPALFWDLHWRDVAASWLFRNTGLLDLAIKVAFRVPYALVFLEAIATIRAWRRIPRTPEACRDLAARAAQCVFAAALLAALSKPRDWIHLAVLVTPIAPIAARQLAALARALSGRRRTGLGIAAGIVGLVYLGASAQVAWQASRAYAGPIRGPHGHAYARPPDAAVLQGVIDVLATTPAERPVLAVPCVSAATFFVGRPSVSRFPWLWPRDAHRDRDEEVISSLDRHPDATVVYTLSHMPFLPRLQQYASPLFEALAARYRIGPIFGPDAEHLIVTLAQPRAPLAEIVRTRLADRLEMATAERVRPEGRTRAAVTEVAGLATWPLTPDVLWIVPDPRGETRLTFRLGIPERARLRLSVGVNPDLWQAIGPFPLRVRVLLADATGEHELLALRRDVYNSPRDRAWVPLDIDLSPLADQEVGLVLAASAEEWSMATREIVGFENPRLIEAPAP
jgi:hypothetical protein